MIGRLVPIARKEGRMFDFFEWLKPEIYLWCSAAFLLWGTGENLKLSQSKDGDSVILSGLLGLVYGGCSIAFLSLWIKATRG